MKTDKYWEKKALEGYWEAHDHCMKFITWTGSKRSKAYKQLEYAITHFWRPRLDSIAKNVRMPGYEMVRLTHARQS